jgi:hypothetical protein
MNVSRYLSGAAAVALILVMPVAMAQQGTTTGPATSSDVAPSTAIQKQNPAIPPDQPKAAGDSTGSVSAGGAVGAGAPGSPAQSGTQGGPPPQPSAPTAKQ